MGTLKIIGYIAAGTSIIIGLVFIVFLGFAFGTCWYLNGNEELKATFDIPLDDQDTSVTVNLYNQAGQTGEDIEASLEESTLQGEMELFFGPLSMKLVGLRVGVDIPIEELAEEISVELEGIDQ